jgi:hypothetical protein
LEQALLWVAIGASAAIAFGLAGNRSRLLAVAGIAIVVYLASYFVWFALRYLAVVPSQAIARGLRLEPHELADPVVAVLVNTLPPAVPVGLFLFWVYARRKRRESRRT